MYRACAEHVAEQGEARVAQFLALMDQPGASRDELLDLLHRLLDALADRLVEPRDPPALVAFFLREQMAPTEAYEILHERVMGPMLAACASLIGRLIRQPADAEETVLRTLGVMGPLMVFQRARRTSLRALGWPDFEGDRLAQVKAVMWRQAQAMVNRAGSGDSTPPPLAGGGWGRG
jgi:TetR/AcrR family transcriptional regulator, regulator of cefoperazone and chloramphenicol sensitivity